MNVEAFGMSKEEAKKLWKEYVEACKENPQDKFLQDMKKVYNQLSCGRKIVDINTIFQRSGLTFNGEPRLAIALATEKKVRCKYKKDGTVIFLNMDARACNWDESTHKIDVVIENVFPKIPEDKLDKWKRDINLETIVPKIPASLRPKGKLENYYVLWEVEKWKMVPPVDPYLLRRINDNMFVVVAGWNLTELERAVMKGRVW